MQRATAAFVCMMPHYSPAMVQRTPSRLDPQTHPGLPTNCRNKLGELSDEEPTHFTSLQMVTIPPSPRACKQRGKRLQISFLILQVIHTTPVPQHYEGQRSLIWSRKSGEYLQYILTSGLSQAWPACPCECRGRNCQELRSKCLRPAVKRQARGINRYGWKHCKMDCIKQRYPWVYGIWSGIFSCASLEPSGKRQLAHVKTAARKCCKAKYLRSS